MWKKVFYSNPGKDRIVCGETFNLLQTLHRLGLDFPIPIRPVMIPLSVDGIALDKFEMSLIRVDK